jgi:hypothetical protein
MSRLYEIVATDDMGCHGCSGVGLGGGQVGFQARSCGELATPLTEPDPCISNQVTCRMTTVHLRDRSVIGFKERL